MKGEASAYDLKKHFSCVNGCEHESEEQNTRAGRLVTQQIHSGNNYSILLETRASAKYGVFHLVLVSL